MDLEGYKLINSIPAGVFVFNFKNIEPYIEITAWNKNMEELTGFNFEEINLNGWKNIFLVGAKNDVDRHGYKDKIDKHDNSRDNKEELIRPMERDFRKLIEEKTMDFKIKTKDNELKFINISISFLNEKSLRKSEEKNECKNEEKNILAVVKDITREKMLQEEFEEYRGRTKYIFNKLNDAIYLNKLDDKGLPSQYIEVNDVACKRLGYTMEELKRMTIFDINTELNTERYKNIVKKLMSDRKIIFEAEAKSKNGELIPVEINSILITIKGEWYALSISREITERKRNENILRENEKKYRNLVESLPYGVFIRTKDRIIYSNKIGLSYMGLSKTEEIIGKNYSDIFDIHPSFQETFNKEIQKLSNDSNVYFMEEKIIRKSDKKVMNLETNISKYPNSENEEMYLVVTRDISDRIRAEELNNKLLRAEEYEKLRTDFFANVSHELRTPINVISSTLQLISLKIKNADNNMQPVSTYNKYISSLNQNCYRLVKLINNLIDVTKIDAGYLKLNLKNENIVEVVENISTSVLDYINNKGINLVFDTNVEEKFMAFDKDGMERIMLNLISNAVKFTDSGGSIFINVKVLDEYVEISIEDTGIGIEEDKQKLIFERFVQAENTLARNKEGSGIGLSLVKSLVEMHKGTISLKSKLGEGSEFKIILPTDLSENSSGTINNNKSLMQGTREKINIEFSDI